MEALEISAARLATIVSCYMIVRDDLLVKVKIYVLARHNQGADGTRLTWGPFDRPPGYRRQTWVVSWLLWDVVGEAGRGCVEGRPVG